MGTYCTDMEGKRGNISMTTYAVPAIDLRSLIESRAPTRLHYSHVRTDGGVYTGICPFPGCSSKNDAFHVWPNSERPRYWCRVCGRKGDAISFLRQYEGKSYHEALRELDLDTPSTYASPPAYMTGSIPPSKIWQETGRGVIRAAQAYLHSSYGAAGLAYLYSRGFTDATIDEAMLGFSPGREMEDTQWGLKTRTGKVVIPAGVVIPWYVGDQLWKITLRLGKSSPHRYTQLLGSQECLFNAHKISSESTTVLYEGVFDALSGQQVVPELVHVATDDTHKCRGARWMIRLCLAPRVLVAYDADEPGDAASTFWTKTLPHASRWRPWAKDVNQMLVDDLDILEWLVLGLA